MRTVSTLDGIESKLVHRVNFESDFMQGQPKLAITDFADQRRVMWSSIAQTHSVDEMGVRRLLNSLDALLAALPPGDPNRRFVLHEQAYLYAYLMKVDPAIKLFMQAELEGLSPIAKSVSAAHALYVCGEIHMAVKEVELVNLEKADSADLIAVANQCVHLGLFRRARDLYEKAGASVEGYVGRVKCAAELMEGIDASDHEVSDRLAVAARIVREMSCHPLIGYDVFAMHDEGILFRFVVRDDIERLVEIDMEIDSVLSSTFDSSIDELFSIGICPHTAGSLKEIGDAYNVSV